VTLTEQQGEARPGMVKHGGKQIRKETPRELKLICRCPRCLAGARKAIHR
jgi:hypothetical protein